VPVHLFAFLLPLNGYLYLAMQGTMALWSVSSHDRVALVRWRWFNYVDNHTLHHWFYRCNYGQFFTFWDRIMGTWRDPVEEADTGRVPQGVLR
jgi:lathosterol oxidase